MLVWCVLLTLATMMDKKQASHICVFFGNVKVSWRESVADDCVCVLDKACNT